MKANELRIGSAVHYKDGHIDKEVIIDIKLLRVFDKFPERFSPISLTEERLYIFGFESDNYCDEDRSLIFVKNISETCEMILDRDFNLCDIDISVKIKYVHQLQNLYFALTNTELI